ncbi:MAG: hypothetical protein QOD52_2746, partial [Gaiellaceae bacterium]|nr:hypothetical protein [Gaiellaceae bacterium]
RVPLEVPSVDDLEATMHADLDLLSVSVDLTADDLLRPLAVTPAAS